MCVILPKHLKLSSHNKLEDLVISFHLLNFNVLHGSMESHSCKGHICLPAISRMGINFLLQLFSFQGSNDHYGVFMRSKTHYTSISMFASLKEWAWLPPYSSHHHFDAAMGLLIVTTSQIRPLKTYFMGSHVKFNFVWFETLYRLLQNPFLEKLWLLITKNC